MHGQSHIKVVIRITLHFSTPEIWTVGTKISLNLYMGIFKISKTVISTFGDPKIRAANG